MKVQQLSTVILLSLLITITTTNEVQARSLDLQSACSSSSCGDIRNISYPFRLKGDPASCGDSGYELSCENNRTILHFYAGKYYVKKISYAKHVISLVDVNLANGSCSLPSGSLSSDQVNDDFRYQGTVAYSYTKFVRCSESVADDGYRLVPCESDDKAGSFVYASHGSYYSELNVPKSCKLISMVPGEYINAAKKPSYEAMMKVLQDGFDLGWSVECRDCRVSGDLCIRTTYQAPILFECSHFDSKIIVIPTVFGFFLDALLGVNLIARYILCPIFLIVFLVYKCRNKRKSAGDTTDTANIQQG